MHKVVNGKRVQVSEKEKNLLEAEWKMNKDLISLKIEKEKKMKEKKDSAFSKLLKLGLTKEEIEALLKIK